MKKLSSIWFMWFAFAFGLLSVLMMFTPAMVVGAQGRPATEIFFNTAASYKGAWPTFVGYMLIVVAAIAVAVFALPFIQTSIKVEKIVLISTTSAFVIGSLLVMMVNVWFQLINPSYLWTQAYPLAGTFFAGGFALLAAACSAIALAKDW